MQQHLFTRVQMFIGRCRRKCARPVSRLGLCITALLLQTGALAAEVSVAVATNFMAPMKRIAQQFERDTGHTASLSFGATGQLYAQIRNGAPFAVLLSADDETPQRLEQEGVAVAQSRFTYAIGRLVLWSKKPGYVDSKGDILRTGSFDTIAIANPKLAPYGAAAIEVIDRLGLTRQIAPKRVEGSSITQAFQFVASGNAPLGFVALSQVLDDGKIREGSAWIVPPDLHSPIRQDAALLMSGRANPAALALMKYLQSDSAKDIMRAFGYTH